MQVRLRFGFVQRNPLRSACRGCDMQVRLRFGFGTRSPLRRSCVSRVRNAGEIIFFVCLEGYARQWLIFIVFVAQNAGKVFQFLRSLVEITRL